MGLNPTSYYNPITPDQNPASDPGGNSMLAPQILDFFIISQILDFLKYSIVLKLTENFPYKT
jgi:hypothetical protein